MTIQIGEQTLTTRRPQDLDAKLIAATGCNAAEAVRWLGTGYPQPGHVAKALRPFLIGDGVPEDAELGAMIAEAGAADVAAQVAALYAAVPGLDAEGGE